MYVSIMAENKNVKYRVLLVWNYERMDWIQPFLELHDEFYFVFLSKYKEADDQFAANTRKIERIYWSNYSSPLSIIKTVLPNAIIFMSLTNFLDIALNRVAQKKGIGTAILQHGLTFSQSAYQEKIKRSKLVKPQDNKVSKVSKKWQLRYLLSAIKGGLGIKEGFLLMKYLFQKRRSSDIEVLENNRFAARMPDKLIVYTKDNARIFKERDGFNQEMMIEVGNPDFDKYFDNSPVVKLNFGSYILLIDTPLFVRHSEHRGFGFTVEQAKSIYERIAGYARSRGKNLVIKLHPYSYQEDPLISGLDIFYIKNEFDHKALIKQAHSILSFPSTLVIPAIYFKPTLLLRFGENDFLDLINSKNMLPVVSITDVKDDSPDPVWNQEVRELLIRMCLYKTDGQSLQRLMMAFNDLCRR